MKIALLPQHRSHFKEHHSLLLEEALKQDESEALFRQITLLLEKKGGMPLRFMTKHQAYQAGRDLFRTDPFLSKWVRHRRFSEPFGELLSTKPLRIGFDQAAFSLGEKPLETEEPLTWKDFFSVDPLLGVAIIALNPAANNRDEGETSLPFHAGSVLFARGDSPVPDQFFNRDDRSCFWIIGYTPLRAFYRPEARDPNAQELKHLGYGFGDLLHDRLNPVLR